MYYNPALKILRVPGFHDKDSKRFFGVIMRPDTWLPGVVYYRHDDDNFDIVMPTTFKGLYFKVKNPGLSGTTDPFTGTYIDGDEVTDGTCTWVAVNYNLMLPSETLSSVTYTATDGIVVINTSNTTVSFQFMIPVLPLAAVATGEFTITAHFIKSNLEEDDINLRFVIG